MTGRRYPRPWLAVVILLLGAGDGLLLRVHAQPGPVAPPPGPAPPPVCSRPTHACPSPSSMSNWVQINLKPVGSDCKLDPRSIDDLELLVGQDVRWDFCSECPVDMVVQLDTVDATGPFGTFQSFNPMPQADNLVSAPVPCNWFGAFSGNNAQSDGNWKYSIRAKPASATTFPDVIDPRLEIDDYSRQNWLLHLLALMLGLGAGFWFGRRVNRGNT